MLSTASLSGDLIVILCVILETLQSYIVSIEKRVQAESDLKDQLEIQKNPEMRAKQREYEDARQQLQEIEARLGECVWPLQMPKMSV